MKRSNISSIILIIMYLFSFAVIPAEATTYSGTSETIKWTVDTSTKKLTISPIPSSGTGTVPDFKTTTPPWDKYKNSIKHIIVSANVTSIGQYPFQHLTSAIDATIGKSVLSISSLSFKNCSALTRFIVISSNNSFCADSGVLFNKAKTRLFSYPVNKSGTSYIIPSTVTSIRAYAFSNNKNLKSINEESSSVKEIGDGAFSGASSLKNVYVKNNCISLGAKVFYGSNKLTSVTIPPSVTSITDSGKTLFSDSTTMKGLTVHLAPNSTIYTKLNGKGYNLATKDYSFSCKFNALSGTVDTSEKAVVFGKAYGQLPTPQKDGFTFTGWALGSTVITSNTLVNTAKNHTLVAKYQGKEYTIKIEPNGGVCDYQTITVTFGLPYGALPSVTRDGFIFLGWYTKTGTRVYSDDIFEDESIDCIYAHWQKPLSKVTGLKIKYKTKNQVKLSWDKQKDVIGYQIFKKVNKGKFALHKTVKTNSYVTPKLNSKKRYIYKVRAVNKDTLGKLNYGSYSSSVVRNKTYTVRPKLKSFYKKNKQIFLVRWKATGAEKYEIYQKINKKWKKVSVTSKRSFYFYYKSNKTYSFKVRGYKTVLGHKYYSSFGKIIKRQQK
ncbi:MAG: leucine-rich repeat protein [Ruminococcus sp.]|nr:leucine-rich repeat protein [Ruminococcus sp.]